MPKILIANVDNEGMIGDQRNLTPAYCFFTAMLASRHVWFAEPGDIVILPKTLSPRMLKYVSAVLGFPADTITFLVPPSDQNVPPPLGIRQLLSASILDSLRETMNSSADWELFPYIYDRSISCLASELGLSHKASDFLADGGAELLNDKMVFRPLAGGVGVKLAPGRVNSSTFELRDSLKNLMFHTGAVIVKQDRNSGADGNIVVTTRHDMKTAQGASAVFPVSAEGIDAVADQIWERLAYHEKTNLVVEAYYEVERVLYAEFELPKDRSRVAFSNWGEVRLDPGYKGLILPPEIGSNKGAEFISGAAELARAALALGFHGLIDIDGIVTTDGTVIFNEVNGRAGGCSHACHLARRLAGGRANDRVTATNNRVRASDLQVVFDVLSGSDLAFDETTGTGVVIASEDLEHCGVLETLSIGESKQHALELERKFIDLIQ
ncbi:hypothetical protein CBA19CS22_38325 [Caballeronia novacaledonica]|uniref:Uncharacterized protein n=1 Tax=Caballeronia novacaledonica TaxID=1544861 RepID=A0ACB5R5A2_9BURK|nr:hypothetical protein CBA19CS22_38325 [Caballeronia novacaledonica]